MYSKSTYNNFFYKIVKANNSCQVFKTILNVRTYCTESSLKSKCNFCVTQFKSESSNLIFLTLLYFSKLVLSENSLFIVQVCIVLSYQPNHNESFQGCLQKSRPLNIKNKYMINMCFLQQSFKYLKSIPLCFGFGLIIIIFLNTNTFLYNVLG